MNITCQEENKKILRNRKMKIKPKIPQNKDFTCINDLKRGECFICDGELHLLTNEDPAAVNLATGTISAWNEYAEIIPVEVEIVWERKPHKNK